MTKSKHRPDIPKDLARKIQTAQNKIMACREEVKHAEKRIREETDEISSYEADPAEWVYRVYGPKMEVDAYPPLTRIARMRESLADRLASRPVRALALQAAERALEELETQTIAKVLAMRPGQGRVPWPKDLAAFRGYEEVLDTGETAVRQAEAFKAAEAEKAKDWFARRYDDGASPGEGSAETLAARRDTGSWSGVLQKGRVRLAGGASFRVQAWSPNQIAELQRIILDDQDGAFAGDLWAIACGFLQTGCDWPGFHAWRDELIRRFRHLLASSRSDDEQEEEPDRRNRHHEALRAHLEGAYLPREVVNIESFLSGPRALPSWLYRFWKEQGFSAALARNWFLKSQPTMRVFFAPESEFGIETERAMRNVGLMLDGSQLPLDLGITVFSHKTLAAVLTDFGLRPERKTTACRRQLLELPDQDAVRLALVPHGYLQLRALMPPDGLTWADFQSWRMQIRAMSAVVTDLFFNDVPWKEREILLQ